jgi:hypothetical protein
MVLVLLWMDGRRYVCTPVWLADTYGLNDCDYGWNITVLGH